MRKCIQKNQVSHFVFRLEGFQEFGYRPLLLSLSAQKPSKADRKLLIQISKKSYYGYQSIDDHQYDLVLPAGSTSIEKQVYLPPYNNTDGWTGVDVFVDGKKDIQLSTTYAQLLNNVNQAGKWNSGWVKAYTPYGSLGVSASSRNSSGQTSIGKLQEPLTDDWRYYTSADAVVIPASHLQKTIKTKPKEVASLKEWVVTGGNLWITRCKRSKLTQDKIAELLDLEPWNYNRIEQNTERKTNSPGWYYDSLIQKKSDDSNAVQDLLTNELSAQAMVRALRSMAKEPDTQGWYAWHPYGFGKVYAFESYPTEGYSAEPRSNRAGYEKISQFNWNKRHGISSSCGSEQYADWLIPGIGMAPVLEFQGLITLFVLMIGPLNYWLLWRADKLHLFVLTTPLFAGLVTLCLMGYGVICDGFGNQARARSLTYINQPEGEAVSWSRMTLYAGSAPRDGIKVPKGTAIYPIVPIYDSMSGYSGYERLTTWQDNQQKMKSGWFPSRTAVQFLALKSSESNKNIEVLAADDRVEVDNQLGVPIDLLLVQTEKGKWFIANEIGSEEKTVLKSTDRSDAVTAFRTIERNNLPVMPEGADPDAVRDVVPVTGNRNRGSSMGETLTENLMNREFVRLSGLDGNKGLEVPPYSYIAITSQGVETPFGVENVVESGSFHVTVGRWK